MTSLSNERPAVSVVIPTHRRDDLLLKCLQGVLTQDFSEPFEIVVVDDACSPTTQGIISRARETARHAGGARNG